MGQSVRVLLRHEYSVLPSNQFSSFLTHTHTHTCFIQLCSVPHTHSITPSFSPLDYLFNLSMSAPSSARYTSLVCRLGLLLAQSDAQTHPGRFIVLSYSRFFLHHQLARCRQRSKWPRFSENNDKADCIHFLRKTLLSLSLANSNKRTHTHTVYTVCVAAH